MAERDDFPERVKRVLAERVGYRCSMPECRAATSGPHTEPDKRVSVGVAAHITAAAEGGPRYDANLTSDQRCAPENGIWMCQTHGTLVDRDEARFPMDLLRRWKLEAERLALDAVGKTATLPTTTNLLLDLTRAARPALEVELRALDIMHANATFHVRIKQLIEDAGGWFTLAITGIFDRKKRERTLHLINEEHACFIRGMSRAIELIEAVRMQSGKDTFALITGVNVEATTCDAIVEVAREVVASVTVLVELAHCSDPREIMRTQFMKCLHAEMAGETLGKVVADRMIAIST
jgi:hypothetical protein